MKTYIIDTNTFNNTNSIDIREVKINNIKYPYIRNIRNSLSTFNIKPKTLSKVNIEGEDTLLVFICNKSQEPKKFKSTKLNNLPKEILNEIQMYKQYISAISIAKKWHGNQTYSLLNLPYFYHLQQTEKVIDFFFWELPTGKTLILKIAALLHDILEDTDIQQEEINKTFGEEVTNAVLKVSKFNEEDTKEYEENYYKEMSSDPLAVIVKIADKCANTKQTVKHYSEWHAKRIINGHECFQNYTYPSIDAPFLKKYLNNLVNKLRVYNEK